MTKRNFTPLERWALLTTHGGKCYLCEEPLPFVDATVDHVIPESLAGSPHLKSILDTYGLPADFDLNDWPNWMPAHHACNIRKSARVFRSTLKVQQQIDLARKHAANAKAAHDKAVTDKMLERALATIAQALRADQISPEELRAMAASWFAVAPPPPSAAGGEDMGLLGFTRADIAELWLTRSLRLVRLSATKVGLEQLR